MLDSHTCGEGHLVLCRIALFLLMPEAPEHVPEGPEHVPEAAEHVPEAPEHVPEAAEHVPEASEHVPEGPEHVPEGPEHVPEAPEHRSSAQQRLPLGFFCAWQWHQVLQVPCSGCLASARKIIGFGASIQNSRI